MRRPRIRLTVGLLMIAVAIAGMIVGAEATRRRYQSRRMLAAYHANEERRMRLLLDGGFIHETDETGRRRRREIGRDLDREAVRRRRQFHEELGAKYAHGAAYPWLSVEPE